MTTTTTPVIVSTTPSIEGKIITEHSGFVGSEAIIVGGLMVNIKEGFGANMVKARQGAIEEVKTRALALSADAVVGFRIDYTAFSTGDQVALLVTASGTAVKLA